MGFLKVSSKKKVPQELPNLLLDNTTKLALQEVKIEDLPQSLPAQAVQLPPKTLPTLTQPLAPQPVAQIPQTAQQPLKKSPENEKGFFKDLMEDVTKEAKDAQGLQEWYESKFLAEDIVNQMRSYWEKQRPQLMVKAVGQEIREKMAQKTEHLHHLEQEWQEIYTQLIGKEAQIRDQEKELKALLAEFVETCKRHLQSQPEEKKKS